MNARALAERICRTLRAAGHQAYFVGGCVRDILLEREPADYDVATDATPDRVQQLFPHSLAVGAKFGVIIVTEDSGAESSAQVEVATFRSDVGYSDGRHPDQVVYSDSPQEDVKRRDFTINALLLDPETKEILDFVGGRDDLRAGIIRAIGRAGRPVSRRQAAHGSRRAFCRAIWLRDRGRHLQRHREISPLISTKFRPSAFATNSPSFSPKAPRGAVSSFSTRRAFSRSFFPKSRA